MMGESTMRIEAQTISKLLPHKYPFLLIDRVTKLDPGKSAVGIKNVTINEPYFTGHFPGEPIVPGVLIVESLAQLTAVMYSTGHFPKDTDWEHLEDADIDYKAIASKVGYLVDIKNVKFKQIVRPGDTMELRVYKKIQFENLSQIKVEAYVDGKNVLDGIISVSERI